MKLRVTNYFLTGVHNTLIPHICKHIVNLLGYLIVGTVVDIAGELLVVGCTVEVGHEYTATG